MTKMSPNERRVSRPNEICKVKYDLRLAVRHSKPNDDFTNFLLDNCRVTVELGEHRNENMPFVAELAVID